MKPLTSLDSCDIIIDSIRIYNTASWTKFFRRNLTFRMQEMVFSGFNFEKSFSMYWGLGSDVWTNISWVDQYIITNNVVAHNFWLKQSLSNIFMQLNVVFKLKDYSTFTIDSVITRGHCSYVFILTCINSYVLA